MNEITNLKDLLRVEPAKRIGVISELSFGSAIIIDFLGRSFKVSVPENLDIIAGNTVITLGGAVLGKTKIESPPSVYEI